MPEEEWGWLPFSMEPLRGDRRFFPFKRASYARLYYFKVLITSLYLQFPMAYQLKGIDGISVLVITQSFLTFLPQVLYWRPQQPERNSSIPVEVNSYIFTNKSQIARHHHPTSGLAGFSHFLLSLRGTDLHTLAPSDAECYCVLNKRAAGGSGSTLVW